MALSIQLDRTWIIECDGWCENRTVRGGICVSEKGLILTSWVDITSKNLRGRSHGSDVWFNLKILKEKFNFDLVLLEVEKPKEKSRVGLSFSSFNLKRCRKKKVDLKRGDMVHGLFHREEKLFQSFFGYSCRSFREEDVQFPPMESELSLSEIGDSREVAFTIPIPYLCTKHVISVYSDDDNEIGDEEEVNDSREINYSSSSSDEEEMNNGSDNISESDSDSDSDSDTDDEYSLENLHPDIPIIQVHGLDTGVGSHGCPVFNEDKNIIGMFYFTRSGYQYVLPISFLAAFLSHSISSLNKRRLSRKRTRMESVNKPTKRQKSDSTSAAPPSENPAGSRRQERVPFLGNKTAVFEEVAVKAQWRQENDALKALDDLTNPVTKSDIQLDLKSKKRRRHQGHVQARVSQLASMCFDRSEGNSSLSPSSQNDRVIYRE